MKIFGLDPGPTQSAFAIWDTDKNEILDKGKIPNNELLLKVMETTISIAIEMIGSFGMPVGAETFETVFWIGRFYEASPRKDIAVRILRKDIKMNLCNTTRAKDSNIRQALIDRFGAPGTKKSPGIMYGLHKDMIQAFAVAVTHYDQLIEKEKK